MQINPINLLAFFVWAIILIRLIQWMVGKINKPITKDLAWKLELTALAFVVYFLSDSYLDAVKMIASLVILYGIIGILKRILNWFSKKFKKEKPNLNYDWIK